MKKLFFCLLAVSFGYSQNNGISEKQIDSVISEANKTTSIDDRMDVLGKNFTIYRTSPYSKKIVDEFLEIAKNEKNPAVKARCFRYQSIYYYNNSKPDSSLIILEKANELIREEDDPILKGSVLAMMGGIQTRVGTIQQGIATMLDAQRMFDRVDTISLSNKEKERHKNESLVLANSLANSYNRVEDYASSIENYDRAYKGYLSLGRKIESGVILTNKGDLYLRMEDYKTALQVLLEGNKFITEGKAPLRFQANSNLNIGVAYLGLKDYERAGTYLNKAYSLYEKNENTAGLSYTLTHLGVLNNELGNYTEARNNCEEALLLAIKNDDIEYQVEASECLFTAFENLGDYKKALQIHKEYDNLEDSIFNEANIKKLTQLQMQYEFDKVQEEQKIEADKLEQQRKIYLYLSLIGLFIASMVGFFLYKNNRKNKLLAKQKALLEATVDEKNVLLKETHHRVKNSFQIVSSLLYLQSENIKDHEAQLAMKEAQNRVRSMVLIHQKLYSKDQLVGINTQEYFSDLAKDIFESHQDEANQISYTLDVASLVLDVETITPMGLILNELITNVIKHAFAASSTKRELLIKLEKKSDDLLLLQVIDNGKGMPENINGNSFGIRLIKALSKKLRGKLEYFQNKPKGTIAQLTIHRFSEL